MDEHDIPGVIALMRRCLTLDPQTATEYSRAIKRQLANVNSYSVTLLLLECFERASSGVDYSCLRHC